MPIQSINITDIAVSTVMRKTDKETVHILTGSIKRLGMINPITVRKVGSMFGLVDGLQRLEACKALGLTTISANVIEMTDEAVLESQLLCSHHHIPTNPIQYSRQLAKLLENISIKELAVKLDKNQEWIKTKLKLNKLHPAIAGLVDADLLPLAIAYKLSRLSHEKQCKFVYNKLTKE